MDSDDRCQVHYVAPDLPQPLPTLEEIEEAPETFPKTVNRNKVTRIGQHYVVKRAKSPPIEGWTMLYLKKMTSAAVPTVYAFFTEKATRRLIIIMEYIDGRDLKEKWGDLSASQKQDITTQLAGHFAEIRALPPPGFFGRWLPPEFGNVKASGLPDFLFDRLAEKNLNGPFDSTRELGTALAVAMREDHEDALERSKYWERIIPQILADGPPVFTHGDLQLRNFVLRDDGKVFIIDWGLSGWFPACWEYCYAIYATDWDTDWQACIPKFLTEYPSEACLIGILRGIHITSAF